ncbi:MAG: LysM peptidoglycan-binding domain-containing protein, partial [Pseudomonadota bacterium]|nr:LysM peptidoglycan-binding domain-containing protein [Pseudomonadota bacterium]
LPIVESAFDPFAYSHGRAAGPWQFIPSTGDYFGMKRTWWQDQRRDILKSTNAALDYLQKLSNRFDGDWLLALASYNAGGGTVSRAIRVNEDAGKPTDFWHLSLPRETTAYVPKLLAIAQIVRDPQAHGVTLHPIRNEPYFRTVDIGGQIDLAQAARLADISVEELYLLNPAFNRWATSPDGPHRLLIPVEREDRFRKGLAALPKGQRMQWARYEIQPGDNLGAIARKYRTTPQVLRSINKLKGSTIIAGRTLLIPGPSSANNDGSLSQDSRLADTPSRQREGRQRLDYTVRSGDTLWEIARKHRVNVKHLAKWNNMAPGDTLSIGQTLAVWSDNAGTRHTTSPANDKMVRKVRYAVRTGDSLYAIADRFNVSVNDIKSWNDRVASNRYIQPGQRLTLYVDIRQTF